MLAELGDRGIAVSYYALWHVLDDAGISFKRRPARQRTGPAGRCTPAQQWRRYQDKIAPSRLVFIDETWAKTNMTRTHGRCAVGQRLVDKVPRGHWNTLM